MPSSGKNKDKRLHRSAWIDNQNRTVISSNILHGGSRRPPACPAWISISQGPRRRRAPDLVHRRLGFRQREHRLAPLLRRHHGDSRRNSGTASRPGPLRAAQPAERSSSGSPTCAMCAQPSAVVGGHGRLGHWVLARRPAWAATTSSRRQEQQERRLQQSAEAAVLYCGRRAERVTYGARSMIYVSDEIGGAVGPSRRSQLAPRHGSRGGQLTRSTSRTLRRRRAPRRAL